MKTPKKQRVTMKHGSRLGGCLRRASILAAAISACYVPTVSAQEGSNFVLEEIVVTVRRRVEMEQDVPISMKAMDAEFLRQQNVTELADLGTKVPAVRISNAGTSSNEPIITIRGQRPSDTTLGIDQAAPIYFNEMVMTPSQGLNLSIYDIQSVQVLKGPQGTLFGRNSTGGAILISSKRPGIDFGGYLEASYGNYDRKQIVGAVDLPANDALQFRVAANIVKRDGFQDNVANNPLNGEEKFWDEDSKAMRISMNLELNDWTNLSILEWTENDMKGRIPVPDAWNPQSYVGSTVAVVHVFNPNNPLSMTRAVLAQKDRSAHEIATDLNAQDKVRNITFTNITERDLTDDISLKNVVGYRKVVFDQASDADGTDVPLFGAMTDQFLPYTLDPELFRTEGEQFSEEFQLIGEAFDGDLEWIGGVYLFKMAGSIDDTPTQQTGAVPGYVPGTFPGPLDNIAQYGLLQVSPSGEIINTAYGVFGEGTYYVSDEWSYTLGLRQSWDKREVTVENGFNSPVPPVSGRGILCAVTDKNGVSAYLTSGFNCARTETESYSKPTFRFSANYTPMDGMLYYASLASGYRAGGVNFRGTNNQGLKPFDEEEVLTLELGNKADWGLAGYAPLRTNLALYIQKYDNIQKTAGFIEPTSGAFGSQTINAAKATLSGVEFDVTWAATENLRINIAYAYTYAEYDEWDFSQIVTNSSETFVDKNGIQLPAASLAAPQTVDIDASEGEFPYVPKDSASLSINYDFPIDLSWGEMTLGVTAYWQGKMPTHANPDLLDKGCAYLPDGRVNAYKSGMDCVQGWDAYGSGISKDGVWVDEYTIWDIRFDWRGIMESNFDVAVYSTNVTDEEAVMGGLNVIEVLGLAAHTYAPPRQVGASVRYNF